MKKIINLLFLFFIIFTFSGCSNKKPLFKDVYYSDNFFSNKSNEYNSSLSTYGLLSAVGGFEEFEYTDTNSHVRFERFLKEKGFKNFYHNKELEIRPTKDTVGVFFASKKIKNKTLVYMIVRGDKYSSEWASNFKIDTNKYYHQGFYDAYSKCKNELKYYLENYVSGDIKLFICGYSRGGAVSNLLAYDIDNEIDNNPNYLSKNTNLIKDDFYCYCYEAPRGLKESLNIDNSKYDNVFCIVNENDFIPKLLMKQFGFRRIGVEIYLSTNINDSNFKNMLDPIKEEYARLLNVDKSECYMNDFNLNNSKDGALGLFNKSNYINYNLGLAVEELYEKITKNLTLEEYYLNCQEGLVSFLDQAYRSVPIDAEIDQVFSKFINSMTLDDGRPITDDIMKFILNPEKYIDKGLDGIQVTENREITKKAVIYIISKFGNILFANMSFFASVIGGNNFKALPNNHMPKTTYSLLRLYDKHYVKDAYKNPTGDFYKIYIPNKKTNITVMNNDVVIAKIEDGKPIDLNNNYSYGIKDNEIVIYLPKDNNYKILVDDVKNINIHTYERKNQKYVDYNYNYEIKDDKYSIVLN